MPAVSMVSMFCCHTRANYPSAANFRCALCLPSSALSSTQTSKAAMQRTVPLLAQTSQAAGGGRYPLTPQRSRWVAAKADCSTCNTLTGGQHSLHADPVPCLHACHLVVVCGLRI